MYNLSKLLILEPEKLERLLILFLKFLVILFFINIFYDFNISISEFINNPIQKDFSISSIILFIILFVTFWYILWSLIGELILGEFIIGLLSRFFNKENVFTEVLSILNIAKKGYDSLIPAKHTVSFNLFLQSLTNEKENIVDENNSRIRQYFIILTIILFTLCFSNEITIPKWLMLIGIIMNVNFLISGIILNITNKYLTDEFDNIKKQFSQLAYDLMVSNVINDNAFIKKNYRIYGNHKRIKLEKISDLDFIPKKLNIYPLYYWNNELTKVILDKGLKELMKYNKTSNYKDKPYDILISNIKPDERSRKRIISQKKFAYLLCENKDQMYKNIELLLFIISNERYVI